MCGSMVDIQSPTAEIRRGKKKRRKIETTGQKYNGSALLHRATITKTEYAERYTDLGSQVIHKPQGRKSISLSKAIALASF